LEDNVTQSSVEPKRGITEWTSKLKDVLSVRN